MSSSLLPSSSTAVARQKQRDRDRNLKTSAAIQSALRPLLPLCAGIALRHRNQHRSSTWWARFNVFRRAVKKTCGNGATSGTGTGAGTGTTTKTRSADVLARAAWLHDCVVPSAFTAFSQLTADSRHATLGLALLGALATVKAATEPAASSLAPKSKHSITAAATPELLVQPPRPLTTSQEKEGDDDDADDFGLAVERHSAGPPTASSQAPPPPLIAPSSSSSLGRGPVDTDTPAPAPPARPSNTGTKIKRPQEQQDRVKKKQKQKSRSGARDDISKLFDSLL